MFAGAAREAVFSKAEVVRRVNAEFIPVALKAGHVNNPPDGMEGDLYREIARSKIAPQGICVANSACKVLDWALMFDDDQSVLAFLDHCKKRYTRYPDAEKPVAAERYMRFPSQKLAGVADTTGKLRISDRHPEGQRCLGKHGVVAGTLVGRIIGRALDKDGKPVADTIRQEHYMEARLEMPVIAQETFAAALRRAGDNKFQVPNDLAQALVTQAYLGQLDVNPLAGRGAGGQTERRKLEFTAQRIPDKQQSPVRVRITGRSDVAAGQAAFARRNDGRQWEHEVKLDWEGYADIDLKSGRFTKLVMVARGSEKLRWGNGRKQLGGGKADVTNLPAGHPINLQCGVRYGLIANPCPADEIVEAGQSRVPQPGGLEHHLENLFGSRFLVLRRSAWSELKLGDEQKEKLVKLRQDELALLGKEMQRLPGLRPKQRAKHIQELRQKAYQRLDRTLADVLNPRQRQRLKQVELQQQGFLAIGDPVIQEKLQFTDKQRRAFVDIIQDLQLEMQSMQQEVRRNGNPQQMRQRVHSIRKKHEQRIRKLLTDDQQNKWKELTGKPFQGN